MKHNILRLRCDDDVFKLVLSDNCFIIRFEAGYDGGRNGGSETGPDLGRIRVLLEFSAGLKDEGQGSNHIGEAACVGEKIGDEVGERVNRFSNNMFNRC